MTFLFRSGTLKEKFEWILRATLAHSRNLAKFVFIYKALMTVLQWVEGKKENIHPFLAAFVGGYYVFGVQDKINEQVTDTQNCTS